MSANALYVSPGQSKLDAIGNVDAAGVTDAQVLSYESSTENWVPTTLTSAAVRVYNPSDQVISSLATTAAAAVRLSTESFNTSTSLFTTDLSGYIVTINVAGYYRVTGSVNIRYTAGASTQYPYLVLVNSAGTTYTASFGRRWRLTSGSNYDGLRVVHEAYFDAGSTFKLWVRTAVYSMSSLYIRDTGTFLTIETLV